MKTVRMGDRVEVHYVKRLSDGAFATSRKRAPIQVTVGKEHPRLPGLGLALVGLSPGARAKVLVPADRADGQPDPHRVIRLPPQSLP